MAPDRMIEIALLLVEKYSVKAEGYTGGATGEAAENILATFLCGSSSEVNTHIGHLDLVLIPLVGNECTAQRLDKIKGIALVDKCVAGTDRHLIINGTPTGIKGVNNICGALVSKVEVVVAGNFLHLVK